MAEAAFERELADAIRECVPPGAITVIVADPAPRDRAFPALLAIVAALERRGVARGRQLLLVAGDAPAAELALNLGIPALAHDPDHSACFVAGRVDGRDVELDDELREAEAIVLAGPLAASEPPVRLAAGLVRAIASHRTVAALGSGDDVSWREAARLLEPIVGIAWDESGPRVLGAGAGSSGSQPANRFG